MKNSSSIKVASFKEPVSKFLSLIDSTDESVIELFKKLKVQGKMSHTNETEYWHGNHSHKTQTFTLYRIEEPLVFYILETKTEGNVDYAFSYIEREVFIPNHE